MRYAIVSDLHANQAAWQTVLTDLADLRADKIICLGDVTGYGPNPVEALESVYRVVNVALLGNHDAAVCGKLSTASFSPRAATAVSRHRELLAPAALEWLSRLPLTYAEAGFRCAHGDFAEPSAFHYIVEPGDALPSWGATTEQLLFVGHSHLPGIYVIGSSGTPHFVAPCDFELEEGKRYIINPGSVGYPRAGDCRSAYCLFDDATRAITFRQLPFDSAGYRLAMQGAGLEDDLWVQEKAQQQHLPTLRESPSFAKPAPPGAAAARSAPHARRSPALAVAALAAGVIVLAAGIAALSATGRRAAQPAFPITMPEFDLPSLAAYPLAPPDKNLLPPLPAELNPDGRLEGWRYAFEDRGQQAFSTGLRDSAITLCIRNEGPHKAQLESPLINLAGTGLGALRLSGRVRKSEAFDGSVFYQVAAYAARPDGAPEQIRADSFEVRNERRKSAVQAASLNRKVDLPRRTTHVRFRIEAAFVGTLEIEQPRLAGDTKGGRK